MALRLTMGFSDNPRVQPLKDGIVKPQGIDLDCIRIPSASVPWVTLSSARSRAPWSKGCCAGRSGSTTSTTGQR